MNRRNFLTAGVPVGAGLTMGAAQPLMAAAESKRILSVADFGAKGDSSADDTNAIQRAFDKAQDHDCVYFPLGVYRVTKTVSLHAGRSVRVTGDGPGSRIIAGTDMQDLVRLEHPFRDGIIDYLTIDANNKAQVALRVVGGSYSRMNELDVWKPRDIGIHCGRTDGEKSGVECMITNSRITGMTQRSSEEPGSRMGILVGGNWTDGHYNNLIVKGFIDTGMELQAASNILHEVHIYRSPCFQFKHALRIRGKQTYLSQCYFDNFTHTGVEVLAENVVFQLCYYLRWHAAFGTGTVYPGDCIRLGAPDIPIKNVTIIGNSFVMGLPDEPRYADGVLTAVSNVNATDIISVNHQYQRVEPAESESADSAVIPAGAKSATVNHRLVNAPASVQVTPGGPTAGGCWVENIGDTQFTLRLAEAPSRDLQLFWNAKC